MIWLCILVKIFGVRNVLETQNLIVERLERILNIFHLVTFRFSFFKIKSLMTNKSISYIYMYIYIIIVLY